MTFPARGILAIAVCGGACGDLGCPAVVIGCDCGTVTHLTVVVEGNGMVESAFTCGGCLSVTWFTVTALGVKPAAWRCRRTPPGMRWLS